MKSIVNYIFESVQNDYEEAVRQLTELNQKLDDARKNVEQRINSEVVPLVKKYYDMFEMIAKNEKAKIIGDKEFKYGRYVLNCTRYHAGINYTFYISFGSFYHTKGACERFAEEAEAVAKENSTTKIKINVDPFDNGYCNIYITDKEIETLYDSIKEEENNAFDARFEVYKRVQELEKRTAIGKYKDKQLKADIKASLDVSNAEEFYRVEGLGESEYATCILLPIIPELLKAVKDGGYKIKMKGTCWALIDYPEFDLEDIDGIDNVIPGDYAVGSSNHECEDSIAYFKENPDFAQALMDAFRGSNE